jgi:hypothetical protein
MSVSYTFVIKRIQMYNMVKAFLVSFWAQRIDSVYLKPRRVLVSSQRSRHGSFFRVTVRKRCFQAFGLGDSWTIRINEESATELTSVIYSWLCLRAAGAFPVRSKQAIILTKNERQMNAYERNIGIYRQKKCLLFTICQAIFFSSEKRLDGE